MSNKLRLQITKKYRRNVFINVVVPEGRLYEFDCILDKYVIASTLFKGDFALGRIVDCNHIYKAIEESGKRCLSPREAFKIFVAKGWLDYYE